MSSVSAQLAASPEAVFAALVTPTTYPDWLVGCQDIRSVEPAWPDAGTRFHHRVGIAPGLTVADSTEVLELEEPRRLVLEVRFRPAGRGRVTFELSRSPSGTQVLFDEVPLGRMAPLGPIFNPLTDRRNRASLTRLDDCLGIPNR